LKILDLSEMGHQPMANADGSVIIAFNGEIYNAFDYTRELEASGFRFHSRTDTEVILYLYEKFGLDGMLERLNGMFAIVIVDLRARELHLVRDHLGVKPFYWTIAGSALLFASEAKAFLSHPAFCAEIDPAVVDEYLAFRYVSGERSLLKNVQQLRPGHAVRVTASGATVRRYWEVPDLDRPDLPLAEAVDRLDAALKKSVSSQLLSDVKVGCQLSGGIDSSLVSVLARAGLDADMDTFSVVFDDPLVSEERWVSVAVGAAQADSHRFRFTPRFFFDTLDKATWHMDQPMSHPNSLGIWLLGQKSRDLVTVLLSGEGADEVFGGYTRFYYAGLRPKVSPWLGLLKLAPSMGYRLERQFGGHPVDTFIAASLFQRPQEVLQLRPEANFEPAMVRRRELFGEGRSSHVSNCLKYEMQTYLVDLLVRQDKMTMAHSVENRVPYLDRDIVSLARSLPIQCLVSDKVAWRDAGMRGTKVVLKEVARRTFDDTFVYRKKSGFSLPLTDYFADKRFEALMEDRLLPGMARRGLVQADAVWRQWKALPSQPRAASETLWISVALELWGQAFLDQRDALDIGGARTLEPGLPRRKIPAQRVVVCWAGMQGYFASCLQALARRGGTELFVVHLDFRDVPSQEELLGGIPNIKLPAKDANGETIARLVQAQKPDIVLLCGWFYRPYRQLTRLAGLQSAKFVLGMDTQWTGSWRQQVNRIRLRRFIHRMDGVIVAGNRSRELASQMGTPDEKIRTGLYGFDFANFETQGNKALEGASAWPQRFLFAGRYVPEKGLGVLLDAYRVYRSSVSAPWPISVCGSGPEAHRFVGVDGVHDLGYVQPSRLPKVFSEHGVFIMPSLEEPWGVAIAEAAATGLPLICTDRCGAADDMLRPPHNGQLVPAGDVQALAEAMTWMHEHHASLRSMGQFSRRQASTFSAEAWAERMHAWFTEMLGRSD
ncbi:MAG: asparagine synthase (glutamine-hydrolyzing), partial [Vicinamibacterales bacterium]